jgi:V/A-type H+-transporting ATPase subunit I
MIYLKSKFKPDSGVRKFLNMFLIMGVVTLVVGILTWSFFGFSPGYEAADPEAGIIGQKVLGIFPLISPTTQILPMLAISLIVGMFFQLASILAGFVNNLRNSNYLSAYCDNLAWIVLFIASPLALIPVFMPGMIPSIVQTIALILSGIALVTIILFSDKESKNWFARILTGIISLYGIVGYYGLVSFASDVLSYMRLSILNLTSGFIAYVANLISIDLVFNNASIITIIVSGIFCALILLALHLLNLFLSMLGSFVHSLRLNYLESFNRYPFSGGVIFVPFKKDAKYFRFET